MTRSGGAGIALLTIKFPHTFESENGVASVELFQETTPGTEAMLYAGVLVVAQDPSQRSVRSSPALPVVAVDMPGADLAALRAQSLGLDHQCPVVEIIRESPSFNTGGFGGCGSFDIAKVGRADLRKEHAPTVLFGWVKGA